MEISGQSQTSASAVPRWPAGKSAGAAGSGEPSADEQRQLQQLKQRDREVRAHEAAHLAAAGAYARGGAHFEYTRGPDGRLYASGGEVSIDSSAVPGDPRATLEKAQTVQRAALAPADPSPQDRRIAAEAAAMAMRARMESAQEDDSSDQPGTAQDASQRLQERIRNDGAAALDPLQYQPLHLIA